MTEIVTSESMAALAHFCSDLHESKKGDISESRCRSYPLEANIDTNTSTLGIYLGEAEGGITQRRVLQLRVEKDLAANDLVLNSQAGDQDEPCLAIADGDARCSAARVKLPYARTSLVDIHLGREGDYFYVHLLVADGNQPAEACPPIPVRFQLGDQGCYQLGEGSHCPPVLPVEQFLNPPPEKPKLLTADFSTGAVLPWPVSLGLLMPTAALVGWIVPLPDNPERGQGQSWRR